MKKTVFNNNDVPYSLHDMNVIAFEVNGNNILMKTQSGIVRTAPHSEQVDGYVEFLDVEWRWCYAYVYEGFYGNIGSFTGKKMYLKDFIDEFQNAGFSITDTSYGDNRVMYTGYLSKGGTVGECTIEIYHNDIVFYEQVGEDKRAMKEIILSADGDLHLYSVHSDVADNLEAVCNDFAIYYVWHGPNAKFLKLCGNQYVAFYGVQDFIDYINKELYPKMKCIKIKTLGSFDDGIPEEYKDIPWYNF